MNASVVTALAALAGAAIGGLTSVFASWLAQHAQARAQWVAQDKLRRQELYKEFIEAASKCYVDALQHDEADIPALVELYCQGGQDANPVLAKSRRKRRTGHSNGRRFISGVKQDLP
jgi:hypothetical protein